MPTRNINLTPELDRVVAERVESGKYDNASQVMRAAVRALVDQEKLEASKMAWLRNAIAEGDASGVYEGDGFADVMKELGLKSPIARQKRTAKRKPATKRPNKRGG
jgi:antitoxin ParD1/3/4